MLFVRPQGDVKHSDGSVSVSRRSLISETWVRFQASFNWNRGNQSSNGALPSCTRSVPSMLYCTIVATFSVVELGAVTRHCCRCNTVRVQLHFPDFSIYFSWLQRCSIFTKINLHLIPSTYQLYVVLLSSYPSLSFSLYFSNLCAPSRYQAAISVAVFPCILLDSFFSVFSHVLPSFYVTYFLTCIFLLSI
jgi:hypothetical protein